MTGLEPVITAAISGIAVPIFQSLWESSNRFLGVFGTTLNEQNRSLIFQASKQYEQNYRERHGIVKVLGMREAVPLQEVYTTVQFLGNNELKSLESVDELEEAFRQAKRRTKKRTFIFREQSKSSGLEVANDKQFLMVLGGPGAGKSTFLRRMGLESLLGENKQFKHRCIPVFIELKQFRSGNINIEQTIAEEFRICKFPDPEKFTRAALEQGKLLILMDGLDEVSTEQMGEVIQQIQDFVDLYDKNRFITSCRVAAYRHNFRRFTDVAMAEFDDDQIQMFISNWFRSTSKTAKDCWEKLNQPENMAAKELTQTPLLLTLVCLLYQRAGKFPAKRATLYEKALRVLLEEWAGEKSLPQEELYKGLDTRLKETLLSEIAHTAFNKDCLFLPRRDISQQIQNFLEESLNDEPSIDGAAVLKSIEVQHGVLVERAEGIYSFSHLTLQEYLTAQYIDDHRKIRELVTKHLSDPRWHEVFLLVAGLMRGGADPLLRRMEERTNSNAYLLTPKIHRLIKWANRATEKVNSSNTFSDTRTEAINIARAISHARHISKQSAQEIYTVLYDGILEDSTKNIAQVIARSKSVDMANERDIYKAIDGNRNIDNDIFKIIDADNRVATGKTRDSIREIYNYFDRPRKIIDAAIYSSININYERNSNIYIALNDLKRKSKNLATISSRAIDRGIYNAIHSASKRAIQNTLERAIENTINSIYVVREQEIFESRILAKVIAYLNSVEKKLPLVDTPGEQRLAFIKALEVFWLKSFQLTTDLLDLSKGEDINLQEYLTATRLIRQCESEAVRVSREMRLYLNKKLLNP